MKVAPFRALTHLHDLYHVSCTIPVEMKVAPFRALTQFQELLSPALFLVEMKVAPFRALTQAIRRCAPSATYVEMKVAPFRALTHSIPLEWMFLPHSGNEGRPFQGIDTSDNEPFFLNAPIQWK